jgi:hypothetical protein
MVVQPVASRYTDYVIPAPMNVILPLLNKSLKFNLWLKILYWLRNISYQNIGIISLLSHENQHKIRPTDTGGTISLHRVHFWFRYGNGVKTDK